MNLRYLLNKVFSSIRNMVLFVALIGCFIAIGVVGVLLYARGTEKPEIQTGNATLTSVTNNITTVGSADQKLTVNSQLHISGQLFLTPTDVPTTGVAGQLLFDKKTNTLQYYDGTKFVPIVASVVQQQTTVTGGVSSVQGQTGAVTLVSGNGIAVSGTTISNNGILDIISAPNGITVSKSGGVATINLPQPLSVTSSPTFAGLTVTGGTLNVNNIVQTAAGQSISINAGADQVSIMANGRTYNLPSSGPANQTICTTGISCVSGGGQSVLLAPGSAQTDNTADVSIFVNDTGGGNLLQLQNGGTDSFVVASNGDTTVGGILRANTITPTSTFTVGASGQSFTLQGTSTSTLKASNGGNTTTVGFITPTANTTLSFPALSAGSYQVCTTSGNCLGAAGGANASLSNLSAVAINTSLLSGSTTIDLGSRANSFRDLYIGGTATNNFRVTGTASAARTITLPDASGTFAVSASGNIALSAAGDISFTGQLAVGSGGTGSGTASGARLNLGAAASGANNDITSLTGLTTALGVPFGGTGNASFTQYSLLVGNGSGALTETAVPGSGGLCLISNNGAAPSFQVCPGGSGSSVSVSSPGTTNKLAKFTGASTIADSTITDTGSAVSVSVPLTAASLTSSLLQSTGALTITPGSTLTIGANNQQFIMQGTSLSQIKGYSGAFATTLSFTAPTANRTILLPDESGTLCIQGSVNCGFASAGSGVTSLNSQTGSVSVANASASGGVVTLNNAAADGSTKGIAGFNSTNFSAASGIINTIQGISTSSSPQFANITLGTAGVVTANNILHTANGQGLSISSASDAITFTAGGINFIFPTTGPGSQTICTTGISCVAGGGQAVLLAPGTAQSDSSTDSSIFINKTANGNIVQLQNSGTNVMTISRAGVMSVNTIAPISGGFSLGSTGNTFTLQGDGSSTISATTGAGVTIVGFTGTAPTGTVRYNFDRNPTGGAGTYTVCTTDGNCSGLSGAVSSPGGTIGRIPKFTGAQSVGDSILSESGTALTVNGGSLIIQGSGGVTLGTAASVNGKIDFKNSTNSNTLTLQSGVTTTGYTLTLPGADGIANQCIKTNGGGQLTFGDCLTGSGGGGGVTQINGNSGSVTIQGTANQVNVTGNGVNPIVLSLPQNIATSSAPTFQSLNLTGTVSAGLKVGSTSMAGRIVIGDGGATEHTATFITSTLTTDKTITIPNFTGSTATLPVTASGFIAIDAAGNIATTGALAVSSGGTGATNASGARTNLGAAASGANADITSTSALNTITPSGTLTVGSTGQALVLQGNASTSLSATNSGITNSIVFATPASSNKTITFPNASGTVCLLEAGNCLGGGSGGANSSLSNLSSVAINTSLLPGATSIDLGSSAAPFRDLYIGGTATNNFRFSGTATGARTYALPDASGTLAVSASGNVALSAAGNISLTGQVPVANGGTGASTAQNAINTLTGLTTTGDLLYYNGTNAVRLARGSDTQCLLSSSTTIQWGTCTGDGVGVTLIGTIDTQTASANGAVISGSTLYMQSASATNPGVVNIGTQTFAGVKTFSGQITANGGVSIAGGQSLSIGGDTFTDLTGTGLQVVGNALQATLGTSVDLTAEVTGILPYANGGTGATGFTTNGVLYGGATALQSTAAGTTGQCFMANTGAAPTWGTCTGAGGVSAIGTIDSQTKSANGAVISGTSLYLQTADATNNGLVSTGTQTFAGNKTFSGTVTVANITPATNLTIGTSDTTGTQLVLDTKTNAGDPVTGLNGGMYYNSSLSKFRCFEAGAWKDCDTSGGVTSGVTTVGTIDSQTKSANGAVISGTSIFLQTADASNVGLVSTGTQTLAGAKTFSSLLTGSAGLSVTGAAVNLNASSNFATNINTGTSTGAITVGNSAAGAISLVSGSTVSVTSGTTNAITVDSGTTGTVNLGTGANAKTVNIGTGAAVANNINLGGTGANVIAIGNTQAGGSIAVGGAMTTGTITVGSTTQTGATTIGQSTATNTISIGNANTLTGNTQTINIGAGTPAGTGLTNINIGNALNGGTLSLKAGAGNVVVGTSDTTGTLLVIDTKTGSGDPTGVNGGMYYNSNAGKFRCFQASVWIDCAGSGGSSPFTDAGSYTYQTTTTDELVVGASTSVSAKLGIVGTSNQTQLLVRAYSGQTAANPLVLFQNSTGSEISRLTVDATGNQFFGYQTGGTTVTGSGNIGLGGSALGTLTTGEYNIGIGFQSLQNDATGSYNLALGSNAMQNSEGGSGNVALGPNALQANTGSNNFGSLYLALAGNTGDNNVALGIYALYANNGDDNISLGANSMQNNVTGNNNIALGASALGGNTSGDTNIAIGIFSMAYGEGGRFNIAIGTNTLRYNSEEGSIAIGAYALQNSVSSNNIGIGNGVLGSITTGTQNTIIGTNAAAYTQTTSSNNSLFGYYSGEHLDGNNNAMFGSETGRYGNGTGVFNNSVFGTGAGQVLSGGDNNILMGYHAGDNITSGDNNIIIGYDLDASSATVSNELRIGGVLQGDTSTLAATFNGTLGYVAGTANTSTAVCRNSSGQLAGCTSSQRYKDDVQGLSLGLEELRQLQPVSYTWNTTGQHDVGFIAEQVATVIPQAVTYDANGEVASFNYNTVTSLLVSSVKQLDLKVTAIQTRLAKVEQGTFDGNVTIAGGLKVSGPTEVANIKVNGKIIGNADTRGTVVMNASATTATYTFTSAYESAPNIVLTPKSNPGAQYWVGNVTTTGFTVYMSSPAGVPTEFNFQAQQ